jgi:hypothetical protein
VATSYITITETTHKHAHAVFFMGANGLQY